MPPRGNYGPQNRLMAQVLGNKWRLRLQAASRLLREIELEEEDLGFNDAEVRAVRQRLEQLERNHP